MQARRGDQGVTPRHERIAYQIHAVASEAGWNMTLDEVADAVGESRYVVRAIIKQKKWYDRLRTQSLDYRSY